MDCVGSCPELWLLHHASKRIVLMQHFCILPSLCIYMQQCILELYIIIRELVDSLCRDGADTPIKPYLTNVMAQNSRTRQL